MRLLVLGGTHHVGRAVVEAALRRGDEVTTVTRGSAVRPRRVLGRSTSTAPTGSRSPLPWTTRPGTSPWTPGRTPPASSTTRPSCWHDRVEHYVYVSSRSVYVLAAAASGPTSRRRWSRPIRSSDDGSDYAAAKRGAEIAVRSRSSPQAVAGGAGWSDPRSLRDRRTAAVVARPDRPGWSSPGPGTSGPTAAVHRRLATSPDWLLSAADRRVAGAFNVVSRAGHATIGELLEACVEVTTSDAELLWASPEVIEAAGVSGWTELPIWVPPTGDLAGLHGADVSAAYREGLTCRPILDTVRGTWEWLQREGFPDLPAGRPASAPAPGLDPTIRGTERSSRPRVLR